jgi:protein O-GlcNAc transferase
MQDQAISDAEVEAWLAAAVAHHGAGRAVDAEVLYRQVLGARPADARAAHNLGALHLDAGRAGDAAGFFEIAVNADPRQGPSWVAWIEALTGAGRYEAAASALEVFEARGVGAHATAPGVRLYTVWGVALAQAGQVEASAARFERALAFDPADASALNNLAGTLQRLNRHAEAETLYRRLLGAQPDHLPALRNLAVLLKDSSAWPEAKALAHRACVLTDDLDVSLQAHLALSPMPASVADIDAQRAGYAAGLEAFAADPRIFEYGGGKLNLPWFQLAYHGRDDRRLMARTAEVLAAKVYGLRYVSPALAEWKGPKRGERRTRVLFCSEFLHDHTIGRLYAGLIRRLDRTRFEVAVAHGPYSRDDAFRMALDADADQAMVLPVDPAGQRVRMETFAPDVLIFPDIGMSAQTWFLANARLAPVQAASWGHPNTTGLPTIDYMLSADRIEPAGAEAAYTERLIRFGRLPCFYAPPQASPPVSRADLGLPLEGVLYGCPQTLFKLHPDFDAVLAAIAQGDPSGHVLLIEAQNRAWTEALKARWAASHPVLLDRVVFLPRMSSQDFVAHLGLIDVLLDPLHFGSGNTLYEAMGEGTPIVTCPGAFARGRIVAGAYAQMGVADAPVAASPEAYASLALALGRDAPRRAALRAELKAAASGRLFADEAAVREFESFLDSAVDAAARDAHLPTGWRPTETSGAS